MTFLYNTIPLIGEKPKTALKMQEKSAIVIKLPLIHIIRKIRAFFRHVLRKDTK